MAIIRQYGGKDGKRIEKYYKCDQCGKYEKIIPTYFESGNHWCSKRCKDRYQAKNEKCLTKKAPAKKANKSKSTKKPKPGGFTIFGFKIV